MRVAIYRCLYGEDFIQESVRSVLPHVDRVFVFKAERPWGSSTGVQYRGEWVSWPEKFDALRDRVLDMREEKVSIVDDYWPTPSGQYEHIYDDLLEPKFGGALKEIVVMEPDWVFSKAEAERAFAEWDASKSPVAYARQVELWRTCDWCVPPSGRAGRATPAFHRVGGKPIERPVGREFLFGFVYNLGFCMSDEVTRWKHLTALAFAQEIRDCVPNEGWFDRWRAWRPGDKNLEPAATLEHLIPEVARFDGDVPDEIRAAVARARSGDEK